MTCIICRRQGLNCTGDVPCQTCVFSGEHCQPIKKEDQQINDIMNSFGPGAYFNEYPDKRGYYVIYTRPDGNTFLANFDTLFKKVGQDKHLGHESIIRNIPYNKQFTVEDLVNAGKGS